MPHGRHTLLNSHGQRQPSGMEGSYKMAENRAWKGNGQFYAVINCSNIRNKNPVFHFIVTKTTRRSKYVYFVLELLVNSLKCALYKTLTWR